MRSASTLLTSPDTKETTQPAGPTRAEQLPGSALSTNAPTQVIPPVREEPLRQEPGAATAGAATAGAAMAGAAPEGTDATQVAPSLGGAAETASLTELMDATQAPEPAASGAAETPAGASVATVPLAEPAGDGPHAGGPSPATAPARRRRWPWVVAGAAVLVLAGLGAGGYAYASHYADHATPGTSVAGIKVSGMTRQQITDLVTERASQATVTIDGDVQATASLTDLGTTVNAQATADAALAPTRSVLDRFTSLVKPHRISVVTTTDAATTESYAASLVPATEAKPTNAQVTLGADGVSFGVVASKPGTGLDAQVLAGAAEQAAATLSPQAATAQFITVDPAVSDAQAQTSADQANAIVGQEVSLTDSEGKRSFTPDAATKASWVTITPSDDAAPVIGIDSTKVGEWVGQQSKVLSKDPVTGVHNVNSEGKIVATSVEAVNGVAVTNAEDVTSAIAKALGGGQPYTGTLTTQEVEAGWTEKTIADGAERLAYPAAPGEKWVDINLSSRTVTAYEGADVVRGPVTVVDGLPATPTVTGTYHVYLKYASQTMRGKNADGSSYVSPDVPWVTYFYQGYAMHGAPWWSTWGFSGSHGCLNMPVPEAKWIYDWSEIGTTVVVHR